MESTALEFYEALADHYHLIFEDWDKSIARQAAILNPLLSSVLPRTPLKILDCACGIGTQAIGFARAGHDIVASDLSPAAVSRAKHEAESRGVCIAFANSNLTSLAEIDRTGFDVVAALDNALPHLDPAQLGQAVQAMGSKLRLGGVLLASIRDYDRLIIERPTVQVPSSTVLLEIAESYIKSGTGSAKTGTQCTSTSQWKPMGRGDHITLHRSIVACFAASSPPHWRMRDLHMFAGSCRRRAASINPS